MISQRLVTLFGLSIPLFIVHGLEEYFNNFYNIDPHSEFIFGFFKNMSNFQSSFLLFQIMLWFLFLIAFLLLKQKWTLGLMTIIGLVYLYEFHHFIQAVGVG